MAAYSTCVEQMGTSEMRSSYASAEIGDLPLTSFSQPHYQGHSSYTYHRLRKGQKSTLSTLPWWPSWAEQSGQAALAAPHNLHPHCPRTWHWIYSGIWGCRLHSLWGERTHDWKVRLVSLWLRELDLFIAWPGLMQGLKRDRLSMCLVSMDNACSAHANFKTW